MIKEVQEIQDYLEITCSGEPQEILVRIADISVYLARTSQLLADAKKDVSRIKRSAIVKEVIEPLTSNIALSATTQKAIIDGIAIDEQHLVDWIERINRTCVHQIDALRSMLSYEKEQLRITKTGY
jgi:hypothetical protein